MSGSILAIKEATMHNPYYDASLTDHIVFFDESVWLTGWEWLRKYKRLSGVYDSNLVQDDSDIDIKLPFVYYAKSYNDNRTLCEKATKDNLNIISGMGGLLLL